MAHAGRWWTYQGERFPLLHHGILVAAFSSGAIGYSALLRDAAVAPPAYAYAGAFATALLIFLVLRIADEFKDHDDDVRFRPYRAVPRGLITLRELGVLAVIALAGQAASCWLSTPALLLPLAAVWLWVGLMTREFFASRWLVAHPLAYLVSHMAVMPLITFLVSAFDWLPAVGGPRTGLGWLMALSFALGAVFELGRKIRAPADEEDGVATYTRLWGPTGAVTAWLTALALSGALALAAGAAIGAPVPVACFVVLVAALAAAAARGFLRAPDARVARRLEAISAGAMIGSLILLGPVPLALRWAGAAP